MEWLPKRLHKRGDSNCKACCCYYPDTCTAECGGLVHGFVADEVKDRSGYRWLHSERCDKCNEASIVNEVEVEFGVTAK